VSEQPRTQPLKPVATTVVHRCAMPKPSNKYRHTLYVCDCGSGWVTRTGRSIEALVWRQVL
jgi:hypothetical protein